MTLSEMDDYPIHQIAEVMRHVGTSDRNFYDRYYFNCHGDMRGDEPDPWLIVGLGVYPNLGVVDGFAVIRHGDDQLVVRASKALGDNRNDLSIGPLKVQVLEGLQRLRVSLEPGHGDISFDLVFDAEGPAQLEPRHFQRQLDRVVFDTMRFVQTGTWTGALTVDGVDFDVQPDTWRGNRDRSWGVRPVGEAEPAGRRAAETDATSFFWIYAVMRFDEFAIVVIVQELRTGERILGDARLVWNDESRAPEWLGRVEHDIEFISGTREPAGATLRFVRPDGSSSSVRCEPRVANYIGFGTGYGLEQDWRHGMWQGDEKVESVRYRVSELDPTMKMFCPVDHYATFAWTVGDDVVTGDGLFEFAVIGPHDQYGFPDYLATAP